MQYVQSCPVAISLFSLQKLNSPKCKYGLSPSSGNMRLLNLVTKTGYNPVKSGYNLVTTQSHRVPAGIFYNVSIRFITVTSDIFALLLNFLFSN